MKRTKKLTALVLALMMALSCMAMTAAAYGAEEHVHDETCCEEAVTPRGLSPECPSCGSPMTRVGGGGGTQNPYSIYRCTNPECRDTLTIYG